MPSQSAAEGPDAVAPQLCFSRNGMVLRCSDTAARMFGCRPTALEGRGIGSLIPQLGPSDSSSFTARRLAHLLRHGGWQRFEAIDRARREFPVDVRVSRAEPGADDPLLLQLRHPVRL